jgi:hypothetical protein
MTKPTIIPNTTNHTHIPSDEDSIFEDSKTIYIEHIVRHVNNSIQALVITLLIKNNIIPMFNPSMADQNTILRYGATPYDNCNPLKYFFNNMAIRITNAPVITDETI